MTRGNVFEAICQPINALHHYVLEPNESYDPSQPTHRINFPYHLLPTLRRTIPSPVRLFSTSHMALGKYGTAVWFDNGAEDDFGQADRGQRLAGMLLTAPNSDGDTVAVGSLSVHEYADTDRWVKVAVCEEEGKIAVAAVDGTITIRSYA